MVGGCFISSSSRLKPPPQAAPLLPSTSLAFSLSASIDCEGVCIFNCLASGGSESATTEDLFCATLHKQIIDPLLRLIDIVKAQIKIAEGEKIGHHNALPSQKNIRLDGFAIQCRVTTEDPLNNFMPDYGKIITYRSASGFGIRLDGAMAAAGSGNATVTVGARIAASAGPSSRA